MEAAQSFLERGIPSPAIHMTTFWNPWETDGASSGQVSFTSIPKIYLEQMLKSFNRIIMILGDDMGMLIEFRAIDPKVVEEEYSGESCTSKL